MQNLHLDDFKHYKFLSNLKHSPDGKYACFAVHRVNMDNNNYDSNLWIYNGSNKQLFQLTALNKERAFTWLDNGTEILFKALRSSKDKKASKKGEEFSVFYKINIQGGEAREVFRIPLKVQDIKPLHNDQYLLTTVFSSKKPESSGLSEKENKGYEAFEEIPYWSNGSGFTDRDRLRLYLYDQKDDSMEALTDETFQVISAEVNEEKTKALVIGKAYTGKAPLSSEIYLADLTTKTMEKVSPAGEFRYASAHFINDQEAICLGHDCSRYGINENARFYSLDLKTKTKKLLTPNFETSTWNSVGSDCRFGGGESMMIDGQYLYFITTERDSSYLNRIDSSGNMEKVTTENGSVDFYSVKNGNVLLIAMRDLKLQELYELDDGKESVITDFNHWIQKERKLVKPEPLSFQSAPGVVIDGWVLKPVDYEEGTKYPGILNIHGGPKTVFGTVFFHEMQFWANEGYFVFYCNPRGSDGKGNEFADIRGKYGSIDYDDLMRFTDEVLKVYQDVDAERVGVTGGSYGGFMTNWIIGHTHRFKAAAAQRSISNWISMGFTTDIGYYFATDQIGATPWSNHDKLWDHSPLKYADQVTTPTLFIHSDEDYRCWMPEALQMFTALKFHGIESRLCLFKGENHELSRSGKPKNRISRLREITDWFDRFLKN